MAADACAASVAAVELLPGRAFQKEEQDSTAAPELPTPATEKANEKVDDGASDTTADTLPEPPEILEEGITPEMLIDVVPKALGEVGNMMENMVGGLSDVVRPDKTAALLLLPEKLRLGLADAIEQMDQNVRETGDWTLKFQRDGLSHLQRACEAAASAIKTAKEMRDAPVVVEAAELKKQMKTRLTLHVHTFGKVMVHVKDDLFENAMIALDGLEAKWKRLGDTLATLIEEFEQFGADQEAEVQRLRKWSRWCKFGAVTVVILGVAATVGAAVLSGGATLGPELAALGGALVVAGVSAYKLHQKSKNYDARAETAAKVAIGAAAGTSILTASFAFAAKAWQMDAQSSDAAGAVQVSDSMLTLLQDLKSKVRIIARDCKSCSVKVQLVKVAWEPLADGFDLARLPEMVDIVVDGFMSMTLEELNCTNEKQQEATKKVDDLAKDVAELARKSLEAFSSFTHGTGTGTKTMLELVDELRAKQVAPK